MIPLSSRGAFHFSRAALPLLLDNVKSSPEYPPTLIFTSATAAMKGSAQCASFATGKFAMRALAQSLAREFGPKNIHVTHAIIDGVIDIERTKHYKFEHEDAKISPHAVSRELDCLIYRTDKDRLRIHTGICTLNQEHALPMRLTSGHILRSGRTISVNQKLY